MVKIKIKGHEFEAITIKDSFSRRAQQYVNNIITSLKRIDLTADDVEIDIEPNGMKKSPATATWYYDEHRLHYSHNSMGKYVENMYVVFKVIDLAVTDLVEGRITSEEFVLEFSEGKDVAKKRKEARITLGLEHNVDDITVIDKAYKELAKKHHPDADGGDVEKFKEINNAHKIIKRELM